MAADHNNVSTFVEVLFDIVNTGPSDVVKWAPAGHGFMVVDEARFAANVLSSRFKSSNFASFVRQLNFYGFRKRGERRKDGHGGDMTFWHIHFIRDRPDLLPLIKRKSTHGAGEVERPEAEVLRDQVEQLQHDLFSVQAVVAKLARHPAVSWRQIELTPAERGLVDTALAAHGGSSGSRWAGSKGATTTTAAAARAKRSAGRGTPPASPDLAVVESGAGDGNGALPRVAVDEEGGCVGMVGVGEVGQVNVTGVVPAATPAVATAALGRRRQRAAIKPTEATTAEGEGCGVVVEEVEEGGEDDVVVVRTATPQPAPSPPPPSTGSASGLTRRLAVQTLTDGQVAVYGLPSLPMHTSSFSSMSGSEPAPSWQDHTDAGFMPFSEGMPWSARATAGVLTSQPKRVRWDGQGGVVDVYGEGEDAVVDGGGSGDGVTMGDGGDAGPFGLLLSPLASAAPLPPACGQPAPNLMHHATNPSGQAGVATAVTGGGDPMSMSDDGHGVDDVGLMVAGASLEGGVCAASSNDDDDAMQAVPSAPVYAAGKGSGALWQAPAPLTPITATPTAATTTTTITHPLPYLRPSLATQDSWNEDGLARQVSFDSIVVTAVPSTAVAVPHGSSGGEADAGAHLPHGLPSTPSDADAFFSFDDGNVAMDTASPRVSMPPPPPSAARRTSVGSGAWSNQAGGAHISPSASTGGTPRVSWAAAAGGAQSREARPWWTQPLGWTAPPTTHTNLPTPLPSPPLTLVIPSPAATAQSFGINTNGGATRGLGVSGEGLQRLLAMPQGMKVELVQRLVDLLLSHPLALPKAVDAVVAHASTKPAAGHRGRPVGGGGEAEGRGGATLQRFAATAPIDTVITVLVAVPEVAALLGPLATTVGAALASMVSAAMTWTAAAAVSTAAAAAAAVTACATPPASTRALSPRAGATPTTAAAVAAALTSTVAAVSATAQQVHLATALSHAMRRDGVGGSGGGSSGSLASLDGGDAAMAH